MSNKSKRKGNRGELELAKILSKRFGKEFSRSIGSGNRWSQTDLSADQSKVFAGDLVCPAGFRFCIEAKSGYKKINVFSLTSVALLDQFLNQAIDDSARCGKEPILCLRQARGKWIVFLRSEKPYNYSYNYRDWKVVLLEEFLKGIDEEYFEGT